MGYLFAACPVLSNASGGTVINTPVEQPDNGGVGACEVEREVAAAIASGVLTIDCALGNAFAVPLSADITSLVFAHVPKAGRIYGLALLFTCDGTSRSITWPASVKFADDTEPTMTATNGKLDVILLTTYDGGVSWLAQNGGQNL